MFLIILLYFGNCLIDQRTLSEFINSVNGTWKATNYQRNIFDIHLGTLLDDINIQDLEIKNEIISDIPDSFSSQQKWPKCGSLSDVRDQSSCGSCWAVSVASVMSDRLCISANQENQKRISAQDILSCCGSTCGFGCDGGYPSGAWKFAVMKGVVTGNEYGNYQYCQAYSFPPCSHQIEGTYKQCEEEVFIKSIFDIENTTPECSMACHSQSLLDYKSDKIFLKNYYTVSNDEEAIKSEIYSNGPVQASFKVYEDFLLYQHGVYIYTSGSYLGGHAVKIIGWGIENDIPYWEVVNSWNSEWGIGGKFKILRGKDHLGIESGILAGVF